MTRTETLSQIAALPVSEAVRAHAKRLIEGLPEWCPMPKDCESEQPEALILLWQVCRSVGAFSFIGPGSMACLIIAIEDDRGAPVLGCVYKDTDGRYFDKSPITDRDVWELLRQLTGMVAITGGG